MSADAADSTNPTTSPEPPAATTAANAVNEVPAAAAAVTKTKDDGIFHESISEDEREYYLRMYPTYNIVRDHKPHCTVCKQHIGTAPRMERKIKTHPILRVTYCNKCHDFYNSGEFSKDGEDGFEKYCRWCGQGGTVYCCSSCPFVFCKSCIVKNLSRSVILDIENNENWSCFSCQPKIIYPLRAMHWALMHFIEEQKREIERRDLNKIEARALMHKDTSSCCCNELSQRIKLLTAESEKKNEVNLELTAKYNELASNYEILKKTQKSLLKYQLHKNQEWEKLQCSYQEACLRIKALEREVKEKDAIIHGTLKIIEQ